MLYSRKSLSFSSDVSNAFAGIAERLEELTGGNVIHGIPATLLPHALLWANFLPPRQIERRETSTPLPSWSWMAWDGPIEFPLYMQEAMLLPGQGDPKIESFQRNIFSPYVSLINDNSRSSSGLNESSGPLTDDFSHVSGGLLKFESFTVPLILLEPGSHSRTSLNYKPRAHAHTDPKSDIFVYLSGIDELRSSSSGILLEVNHDDMREYCLKTIVELVLITESANEDGVFVNFLLVHWLNGYAERFGIGQAHASAWKSWAPEHKTILLG